MLAKYGHMLTATALKNRLNQEWRYIRHRSNQLFGRRYQGVTLLGAPKKPRSISQRLWKIWSELPPYPKQISRFDEFRRGIFNAIVEAHEGLNAPAEIEVKYVRKREMAVSIDRRRVIL